MRKNFMEMLRAKCDEGKFVCVGLDSNLDDISESAYVRDSENPEKYLGLDIASTMFRFNKNIVEATVDLVCAYKPNLAFYVAHGIEGLTALQRTIFFIHAIDPDVPVILDAKSGDIGNTNTQYARMAFQYLEADALTVHPYLGREAMQPFLDYKDKGIFVLCRTSNSGAGEFQDWPEADIPLYREVAYKVATGWNGNGNCGLVVGATCPEDLIAVRGIAGDMPILIPGIGAQGGDIEKTVSAGKNSHRQGMIINASRSIIFASRGSDFADAARCETLKLHNLINQYR
ncbi:MAG: orotidine-5'-phosphate decarboxylase [Candidatus Paceibacterota bacterium]|jgi:orotidine-5'-phosphate decarboxylase